MLRYAMFTSVLSCLILEVTEIYVVKSVERCMLAMFIGKWCGSVGGRIEDLNLPIVVSHRWLLPRR